MNDNDFIPNPFDLIFKELKEIKQILNADIIKEEPPEIIDRLELQKRLGLSQPTVIRWVRNGRIPEIKFGVNCRYNWRAVVNSLEKTRKEKNK